MIVFHLNWKVQDFVIKHVDQVATSDCPEPGSFHSKMAAALDTIDKSAVMGWPNFVNKAEKSRDWD